MTSVALEEIADVIRGVTFSKADATDMPREGLMPVLRAGNISDELDVKNNLVFVDQDKISPKQVLRKSDIVVCMSSGSASVLGKSAILRSDWNGSFGAFLATVRPDPRLTDPVYVSHFLRSPSFRRWASGSSGIGIKNIRASDLKKFPIPLPPLDEQKRIAAILDQADTLCRLRQRAIDRLNTLGQAMFHEMFSSASAKQQGFRRLELNEVIQKGDKINYGVVQPGDAVEDGVPLVRVGDLLKPLVNQSELKRISKSVEEKYSRSRLNGDEILVACVGSIGAIALADSSMSGFNIARAVARLRVDEAKANRLFLAEQLKTQRVQRYFQSETRAVAQPTLNIKQLKETEIFLPPMEKQIEFSERFEELRQHLSLHARGMEKTETLFASLQSRAYQGGF